MYLIDDSAPAVVPVSEQFYTRQIDVYTDGLRRIREGTYRGPISIDTPDGLKTFTGEHDAWDFEREYGFILE
jgi:hypothetical protein